MSVEEPKRTLAYICPACRQSVIVERDLFSLAAATAHIKCPCGRSELRVEFVDDHVDLEACLWDGREGEGGEGGLPTAPPSDFDWERELGAA